MNQNTALKEKSSDLPLVCSIDAFPYEKTAVQIQEAIDQFDRVVGWYPLTTLLQPRHTYFKDKLGYLDGFTAYKLPQANRFLTYPKISGPKGGRMPLRNPYRLRKISRSHTARKTRASTAVADMFKVSLRLAHIVTTCPKPISEWAIRKVSRRQVMWKELGSAFLKGLEHILGLGLGASTNYHTWSTKNPLEPHSHFHHLVANLRQVGAPTFDDTGEEAYQLVEIPWHKQHAGNRRLVPLDDNQLVAAKRLWYHLLIAFASKHHIDWKPGITENIWKSIDLFVEPRDTPASITAVINYVGRNPLEDYAVYSNTHLDCPNPPVWLEKYTNKSRPFGWWCYLKTLVGGQKQEREKLHPVTFEKMEYAGHYSLSELLERNHGALGFLDISKGEPVYSLLNRWELDWLKSVQKKQPVL